jgi:hypothetical protein
MGNKPLIDVLTPFRIDHIILKIGWRLFMLYSAAFSLASVTQIRRHVRRELTYIATCCRETD